VRWRGRYRCARNSKQRRSRRSGYLGSDPTAAFASRVEALRAGLRDLGYVEGRNIIIEFRWAERGDQLPELAADLVRMNVDVIFATSSTERRRSGPESASRPRSTSAPWGVPGEPRRTAGSSKATQPRGGIP
jgi:hypothetical protein